MELRAITLNRRQRRSRILATALGSCALLAVAGAGMATAHEAGRSVPLDDSQVITISGDESGRIFEGIGSMSGGGTGRLLYDYPEQQRDEILDYLFLPGYGASLQHLKFDLAGDGNSGIGSEASHMHERGEVNMHVGYEFWLAKEAKERNPDITLSVLQASIPAWVGSGDYFSQDNIDYIVEFLLGAEREHGLTIDYIALPVNEPNVVNQQVDWDWVKDAALAVRDAGLETMIIVGDDQVRDCCPSYLPWDAAEAMQADPELAEFVDVVGSHYAGGVVPDYVHDLDASVWSSEDGPWIDAWNDFIGGSYAPYGTFYNLNYILGGMVATHVWHLATAYYDNALFPNSGLMRAAEPWSGHYEVMSPIWLTAHTTQFVQPGWQYLDGASTRLSGGGSIVALRSPDGTDYSAIIETQRAEDPFQIPTEPQTIQIDVSGGLSTGTVHVWKTTETEWFVQQADIEPVDGTYTITVDPDAVYTLTTTIGQSKGDAEPPESAPFPFPYADDFESSEPSQQPQYMMQRGGSYEVGPCSADRPGQCVEQVVGGQPTEWLEAYPTTYLGDADWTDYEVSVSFLHQAPGSAEVWGRIGNAGATSEGLSIPRAPDGYVLSVEQTGRWRLGVSENGGDHRTLAHGHLVLPPHEWHIAAIAFDGGTIVATVDGVQVARVEDATYSTGRAGIGTGWNRVQFDDFAVNPWEAPPVPETTAPATTG